MLLYSKWNCLDTGSICSCPVSRSNYVAVCSIASEWDCWNKGDEWKIKERDKAWSAREDFYEKSRI